MLLHSLIEVMSKFTFNFQSYFTYQLVIFFAHCSKSYMAGEVVAPLPPETKDFCFTHRKKKITAHYVNSLTGSPIVTTPYILMTLVWLNWPIMAASCRNLTLSSSEDPAFKVLTASSSSCLHMLHDALYTSPN